MLKCGCGYACEDISGRNALCTKHWWSCCSLQVHPELGHQHLLAAGAVLVLNNLQGLVGRCMEAGLEQGFSCVSSCSVCFF